MAEKTVARRMLLAHLVMTMITKYEKVLTAHYARGLVHRVLANKLLLLMEDIERRVGAPKQVRCDRYATVNLDAEHLHWYGFRKAFAWRYSGTAQSMLMNYMTRMSSLVT